MSAIHDVIVIGSGPAGYTAALYAARAQLKPLVFEGSVTAGGALMNTTEVENFPGFPGGMQGPDLMDAMRKQAERFGAVLLAEDVTEVDLKADPKRVISEGETYLARAVIVATGSRYRELDIPGEKRLSGHGVSWCATCDGFFFREQEIAVVGGGDSAMEEALFLTRFASTVTVIHRRDELRASKIMQERAFANPKIKFRWNSEVSEVLGDTKITGLRLRDTVTGEQSDLAVGGVFVAIGHGLSAGLAALFVSLQPLLTSTIANRWLGERVTSWQWFGLALGVAGVYLIVRDKATTGDATPLAWAAGVVALLGITLGTLYQKRFGGGIDWRPGMCIQYGSAAILFTLGAFAFETRVVHWTPAFVFAVGWLVLVLSFGAVWLLYFLIRRAAATRVVSLFYLTPPLTALMAWAFFGERLAPLTLVGMAICVAGVFLVMWKPARAAA